ncbi:MAG: hypothetical protein WCB04_01845, partial [Mycobacteriales bacterium]
VGLLALVVACGHNSGGSGSKVSATTWAKNVCTAIRPWAGQIQTAVTDVQSTLAESSDPKVVKPQLTELFSGAATSTDKTIAKVDAAGVPDVSNGTKIAKDFRAALVSARDAFATANTSVAALDTADKKKFDAAVSRVGTKLNQDNAKAGNNIHKATSAELTAAFDKEPACQ